MKITFFFLSLLCIVHANNADYGFVLFQDIRANVDQYISLFMGGSDIQVPEVIGEYYQMIATYTDDSYSYIFSDFPVIEVTEAVEQLPWYSTRLSSTLSEALNRNNYNISTVITNETSSATTYPGAREIPSFFQVPSYAYNKSRSTITSDALIGQSDQVYSPLKMLLFSFLSLIFLIL